jgi:hypothetical protein
MPQHTTHQGSRRASKGSGRAVNGASPITGSEGKIRLTAFFVLLLIIVYMITGIGPIPVFLLLDFTLRGFGLGAYSPLAWISGRLAAAFKLPAKPVYMPPKRFAARVGFLFCLAIVVAHYADLSTLILSAIIALFAALESLAGFCAGCYVYNAYARLRSR